MFSKQLLDELEKKCPETVMIRGVLENALPPDVVDAVFDSHRQDQYQRKIMFSTIVQILGAVVFKVRKSVNLACTMYRDHLDASVRAVFGKLNRTEPVLSAALVRVAYERMAAVVDELGSAHRALFPGYQTLILDGNHLAATDHRIGPLRRMGGGALPGVAVVVLDRERELFHSVELSADAYTQERVLGLELIGWAKKGELWIGDRNFCTSANVWQLNHVGAGYLIRRHKVNVAFETVGKLKRVGETETGTVFEQAILIRNDHGDTMPARLIRVELNDPTRDGEVILELLTNLPKKFDAIRIADAYRQRWDIETGFAEVEKLFSGEIPALGQPGAALLAFCLALIAWSSMGVLKAALRKEHGHDKIVEELSMYYLVDMLLRHNHVVDVMGGEIDWHGHYSNLTPRQMANRMSRMARQIDLTVLKKNKRGPKKRLPKPKAAKNKPHFSTWRVINNIA